MSGKFKKTRRFFGAITAFSTWRRMASSPAKNAQQAVTDVNSTFTTARQALNHNKVHAHADDVDVEGRKRLQTATIWMVVLLIFSVGVILMTDHLYTQLVHTTLIVMYTVIIISIRVTIRNISKPKSKEQESRMGGQK